MITEYTSYETESTSYEIPREIYSGENYTQRLPFGLIKLIFNLFLWLLLLFFFLS